MDTNDLTTRLKNITLSMGVGDVLVITKKSALGDEILFELSSFAGFDGNIQIRGDVK